MIDPRRFSEHLAAHRPGLATGVPDSLLKHLIASLDGAGIRHIVAANEGLAVSLAVGHHFATGEVPIVYLQNSGLGNTVNPILSLADPEVFGVPLVLLIGWRGRPGCADEPQHHPQGRATLPLLQAMAVPSDILAGSEEGAREQVDTAFREARRRRGPYALVVSEAIFAPIPSPARPTDGSLPTREQAIRTILPLLDRGTAVVASTGMIAREVDAHRGGIPAPRDLLVVGSMGHASSIALGIALARPALQVCCLDGDGAAIMHLGSLATCAQLAPPRLIHIILNNRCHDSVGGQPTTAPSLGLHRLAAACGYHSCCSLATLDQIAPALADCVGKPGPHLLEVLVRTGCRPDLGRPREACAAAATRLLASLDTA